MTHDYNAERAGSIRNAGGVRGVSFAGRKAMQVLGTLMIGQIALNALIFVSLLFFRRSRPELQAQLFSWLVRSDFERRSRTRKHSHLPA
jgi:hypothetical protein